MADATARAAVRADPDEPYAFDTKQAGDKLGVQPQLIRRHVKAGTLKGIWLGRLLRIPVSEIRRVAEEGLPRLPPEPGYEKFQARYQAERAAEKAAKLAKAKPPKPKPLRKTPRNGSRHASP